MTIVQNVHDIMFLVAIGGSIKFSKRLFMKTRESWVIMSIYKQNVAVNASNGVDLERAELELSQRLRISTEYQAMYLACY